MMAIDAHPSTLAPISDGVQVGSIRFSGSMK